MSLKKALYIIPLFVVATAAISSIYIFFEYEELKQEFLSFKQTPPTFAAKDFESNVSPLNQGVVAGEKTFQQ